MKKIYFLLLAAILGTGFSFSAKAFDFPAIDPEPGSTVESFSKFSLVLKGTQQPGASTWSKVTLSNGSTTYEGVSYVGFPVDLPDYSGKIWTFEFLNGQVATEDGEWTLSLPEGFVTDMGTNSPAYTATYFIGEPKPATAKYASLTPESGSTLESFEQFTLKITAGYPVPNQPSFENIKFTNGTTTITGARMSGFAQDYDMELGVMYYAPTFTLSQAVTEAGEWTLEIPEGLFSVSSTGDNQLMEAVTATYTIGEPKPTTEKYLGIDPASGSTLESFETFTLEIGGYPLRHDEILKEIKFTNGTTTITGASNINMIYGDTYKPVLKLSQAVTEEGEWTLIIPEGAFSIAGGDPLEAFTATYTIAAPKILEYVGIEPATESTLKKFASFKLLLPFDEMAEYQANIDASLIESITMSNGSTTIKGAELVGFEPEWGTPYLVAEFALPEVIAEAGEWTLEIPQGLIYTGTWDDATESFLHNGDIYSALTAKYTIDPNAKSKLDVFTLTPASGSEVEKIEEISMVFYEYTAYEMGVETPDELELTNGKSTVVAYVSRDWNVEDYLTFIIAPEEPITEPGTWKLSVAEGAFSFGAEANAAFEAEWTIPTPANYILTPEPGSTIENANEFTIEFPYATKVEFAGDAWSVSVTNGNTWGVPSYKVTEVEGAEHPTFKFTIPEDAAPGRTPMGTVHLIVEEGAFIVDGTPSEEISAVYVVSFEASTDYTQTPESILVPDDYGYVYPTFVFDEGATVRRVGDITVTLGGINFTDFTSRVEGIYLAIIIPVTAEDYGKELKVSLPEGGVLIGDKPSTVIEGTWTIEAPRTYAYELSPNPDETVSDLSTITVIFPEAKSIEFFEYWNASLRSSNYSYYQSAKGELLEGDQVGVKLTFDPAPTAEGEYTFTLREGSLTLDGAFASPEVKVEYNFDSESGVEGIAIDAESTAIFNLQGIRINTTWSELAPGIYIVNGKKVAKK
ncbi:MAG: hypothetical protein HDS65_03700 [Bacteroidales bacterium]|nr:hypothetical protein [Bacteroidales bacterium]